jgi:high-affinity Fe2+/Pb2+ permease
MARYSLPVFGAMSGAVVSGLAGLVDYRFAEHDSWARALTFTGIWVILMTAVLLGVHVRQERRDDRAQRIEDAADSQSHSAPVHSVPSKMR